MDDAELERLLAILDQQREIEHSERERARLRNFYLGETNEFNRGSRTS